MLCCTYWCVSVNALLSAVCVCTYRARRAVLGRHREGARALVWRRLLARVCNALLSAACVTQSWGGAHREGMRMLFTGQASTCCAVLASLFRYALSALLVQRVILGR